MEPAAAGGACNEPAKRLPEASLNGIILRWAFIDKAISGFGALALAWATIVLLGGFSTVIKQKDFWFVTIISFMEATRLLSRAVYPADQFIINAPEVLAATAERNEAMERGSWRRHGDTLRLGQAMNRTPPTSSVSDRFTCRLFSAKILSMGFTLALLAANVTSVILAVLRLMKQDFVDPRYQGRSDHKNIKGSLNLFYGLVLALGVSSFLVETMLTPDIQQLMKLSLTYKLGASGPQIIKSYMLHTYMKCFRGSLREAMKMELVAFAKERARSDLVEDRLIGVRTLDRILRGKEYRRLALMRLRDSIETVGIVVNMLGLKTTEEEDARGHAANVVLELSPDLLVESYPAMLQQISSLLVVKTTTTARGHAQHPSSVSIELTWFGVQILNKIMDSPGNCKQVKDADDQVISRIVDLTTCSSDNSSISSSEVGEDIIVVAVQVLHKLASTTGVAGRVLRSKISENVHVLRNIRRILEHPKSQSQPKLLVEAMGILACLALDETGSEDIGSSPRIIRRLLSFLVENASDRINVAEAAAEALVMLAIDSESNRSRILEEMKPENMQQLVQMLSADNGELKTMVAKLLWSLRTNSKEDLVMKIDSALPELLKAIKLEVEKLEALVSAGNQNTQNLEELRTKQGKLLESFVGLSVEICRTFIEASDFNDALSSANLTGDLFVQKLKKILDLYESPSPTTEFPGIRRATVELIILMTRAVDNAMKEVAETEARLERFKLFYCGVGVAKHSESISSLVIGL